MFVCLWLPCVHIVTRILIQAIQSVFDPFVLSMFIEIKKVVISFEVIISVSVVYGPLNSLIA